MKKVYHQPYAKDKYITCWYGKPHKGVFEGDVIRIEHPYDGEQCNWWMTPDEAAAFIRALSAGLHYYLVDNDKLAKLKEIK